MARRARAAPPVVASPVRRCEVRYADYDGLTLVYDFTGQTDWMRPRPAGRDHAVAIGMGGAYERMPGLCASHGQRGCSCGGATA